MTEHHVEGVCVCVCDKRRPFLPFALTDKEPAEQGGRLMFFIPRCVLTMNTPGQPRPLPHPSAQRRENTTRVRSSARTHAAGLQPRAAAAAAVSPLLPSEDNKGESDLRVQHRESPGVRWGGDREHSLSVVTPL